MEANHRLIIYGLLIFIALLYYLKQNHGLSSVTNQLHNTVLSIYQTKKSTTLTSDPTQNLQAKAWIDLNNTGEQALFIGGKVGEPDQLLMPALNSNQTNLVHDNTMASKNGKMVNVIDQIPQMNSLVATYAAVAVDLDYNGYTDLVVAREDGVTLYINQGRSKFKVQKLLGSSRTTVPISLAVTDYNKDGHVDIYISQHTHPKHLTKNPNHVARNVLLEGIGAGVFEDVTVRTGTLGSAKNTLNAQWVDLNNDKLPDLVLTQADGTKEVYANTRGASGAKYTSGPQFFRADHLKRMQPSRKVASNIGSYGDPAEIDVKHDQGIDTIMGNGDYSLEKEANHQDANESKTKVTRMMLHQDTPEFQLKGPGKYQVKHDNNLGWAVMSASADSDPSEGAIMGTSASKAMIKDAYHDLGYGGDLYWLNITGQQKVRSSHDNFIGVKLPATIPFMNAIVHVASVDDRTGKMRDQTKQVTFDSQQKEFKLNDGTTLSQGNVIFFPLKNDNRVVYLEVNSIYDGNHWQHPRPKINTIATFRDMRSNPYTA